MGTHPYSQSTGSPDVENSMASTAQHLSGCTDVDPTILSNDIQFDHTSTHVMLEALKNLLEAEEFLIRNTSIEDVFFVETVVCECIITLGALMNKVPCLKPWDIVYGEKWNVLTHGVILMQLAKLGRIDVFLGLPCQSFTFARDPALRSL